MRGLPAAVIATAQLTFFALFPAAGAMVDAQESAGAAAPGGDEPARRSLSEGAVRCTPRQIKGGLGSLLNCRGELRLFFPHCLAIAAPVLLYRLKREGFSRCSVETSDHGLLVLARR